MDNTQKYAELDLPLNNIIAHEICFGLVLRCKLSYLHKVQYLHSTSFFAKEVDNSNVKEKSQKKMHTQYYQGGSQKYFSIIRVAFKNIFHASNPRWLILLNKEEICTNAIQNTKLPYNYLKNKYIDFFNSKEIHDISR